MLGKKVVEQSKSYYTVYIVVGPTGKPANWGSFNDDLRASELEPRIHVDTHVTRIISDLGEIGWVLSGQLPGDIFKPLSAPDNLTLVFQRPKN